MGSGTFAEWATLFQACQRMVVFLAGGRASHRKCTSLISNNDSYHFCFFCNISHMGLMHLSSLRACASRRTYVHYVHGRRGTCVPVRVATRYMPRSRCRLKRTIPSWQHFLGLWATCDAQRLKKGCAKQESWGTLSSGRAARLGAMR